MENKTDANRNNNNESNQYLTKKRTMETKQTNQMRNNLQEEVMEAYEKPAIEVIEMEMEGILCASGDNFNPGGGGGDSWE